MTRVFAWLCLAAVAGWTVLAVRFFGDSENGGGPLDGLLNGLRLLTPIATVGLGAASLWYLPHIWRERQPWSLRFGALLLTAASLVLIWVTVAFHLYGFSLLY